ncbi:MAG: class I SAM-dependent methyltransferase [Phycisphaerales bacterium]
MTTLESVMNADVPSSTPLAPPSAAASGPRPSPGDPFEHESRADRLRRRLIETTAELCAARGMHRVALCGAPRDLWPIARQPWQWYNLRATALLIDRDVPRFLRGVPVRACVAPADADALIVCSQDDEHCWYDLARRSSAGVPILRPYFSHPAWEPDETALGRLVEHWNTPRSTARWLIANRGERHDATLPMLLPWRTELHLRRYEFAARYTPGKRVADIACGLGYGSSILVADGAAACVHAVDICPEAIGYARSRFAHPCVEFRAADACASGLPDACVDVVTSFETIEHVAQPRTLLREFHRVLASAGTLVLSTPNDWGLTEHHVQSFTFQSLSAAVEEFFDIQGWWTQRDTAQRFERGVPEGFAARRIDADPAETLILVGRRRGG